MDLREDLKNALDEYNNATNRFNHANPVFIDECILEVKVAKDRYNLLIREMKNKPSALCEPKVKSPWTKSLKKFLFL